MLNMNIDWYEKMTPEESLERYDWGHELMEGSTVYRSNTAENVVMVGLMPEGEWVCEIEGEDTVPGEPLPRWNMIGQGFGETPDKAIEAAVMDVVGFDVMRENANCEDSVNVAAYEAYVFMYGEEPKPFEDSWLEYDNLKGVAIEFVKEHCEHYGFEWEEF